MQAIDTIIRIPNLTPMTTARPSTSPAASLLRSLGRRCELIGVLALMGSSAAYGLFALAHLGL